MIVAVMIASTNVKGLNIRYKKNGKSPQWSKQQILGRSIFLELQTLG